ncbi:endonuclease domain-containing protein [Sphingomonas corticis]|uniref:endonuclease domain-containing protein n=1 Tax=Sphingomonas corticis TaxID=2722791 RepID=UPI0030B83885
MDIPPRYGEGDQPQAGGGVFATERRTIEQARRERRSGNLPEVILWRALRTRPAGLKFRRQHPIGPYCLDFACLSARLAIEVDGEVHGCGDHPRRDALRDADLLARGIRTLRIPAREVLADPDAVVRHIVAACGRPLHQPAAGPPPRAGEV